MLHLISILLSILLISGNGGLVQASVVPCIPSRYVDNVSHKMMPFNNGSTIQDLIKLSTQSIKLSSNGSYTVLPQKRGGQDFILISAVSGFFPGDADQGLTLPAFRPADMTIEFFLQGPGNKLDCMGRLNTIDDNSKPDWGKDTVKSNDP